MHKIKDLLHRSFSFEPKTLRNISKQLKISEKILISLALVFIVGALFSMYLKYYNTVAVEVPTRGGEFTEGIVGTPRFINPILSVSDSDRDMTGLIFAGLLRSNADGNLTPELAEKYEISEDGKEYIFYLKKDALFHDGKPVTADDVIFTVNLAKNPAIKSHKRADWEGVEVEKINEKTVKFILKKPYTPFLENTTMGILPKHLWEDIEIDSIPFDKLNIEPVGAGPFKIRKIKYTDSNAPEEYILQPFDKYSISRPLLDKITIKIYSDKKTMLDDFQNGVIDAVSGISPSELKQIKRENAKIISATYPRIFAVFFNPQNNKALADENLRKALDALVDKEKLVKEVFLGYAKPIVSPVPTHIVTHEFEKQDATEFFKKAGYTFNSESGKWEKDEQPINITLVTADTKDLQKVAEYVAQAWTDAGINVKLEFYKANELNQNVIRTRDYEALLFGEVVGRTADLFAFWHSSQRDDPGLNIALYTNAKVDKLLEKARAQNKKERAETYKQVHEIIKKEVPAVFLYSPDFIYIMDKDIKIPALKLVSTASDRFSEIYKWFKKTNKVWPPFAVSN